MSSPAVCSRDLVDVGIIFGAERDFILSLFHFHDGSADLHRIHGKGEIDKSFRHAVIRAEFFHGFAGNDDRREFSLEKVAYTAHGIGKERRAHGRLFLEQIIIEPTDIRPRFHELRRRQKSFLRHVVVRKIPRIRQKP